MPNQNEILVHLSAKAIMNPLMNKVHCVMDGVKLYLQKSELDEIQDMFYNGWRLDHYVTCVLVFVQDSLSSLSTLPAPCMILQSQTRGVYSKLSAELNAQLHFVGLTQRSAVSTSRTLSNLRKYISQT
eukprot:IDg2797t1